MAMGITSGVGRISSIISQHYSIPKCPATITAYSYHLMFDLLSTNTVYSSIYCL